MRHILATVLIILSLFGCAEMTPEQKGALTFLVRQGVSVAVAEKEVWLDAKKKKAEREHELALLKIKQDKELLEKETEPLPPGIGERKKMCVRHVKSGPFDGDGGFAVGEPRDGKGRRFKTCSINGKSIPPHGDDNGGFTHWGQSMKAESGTVICIDYLGWKHEFKSVANKNSGPQCN